MTPKITICARWEFSQMDEQLEWRMWKQLGAAYGVSDYVFVPYSPDLRSINKITQYPSMTEALKHCSGKRVFLEEKGDRDISEIPSGDIVLILGNTSRGNLHLAREGESFRIKTPHPVCLYGVSAAAIALQEKLKHEHC